MRPVSIAAAALALAVPPGAAAMQFFADPPFLHLQGRVESTDWAAWEEAMERFGDRIDTIVFHRSPGGHTNTGRRIGAAIREKGFRTVVADRCVSACANMFLGGKERVFSARMTDAATLGYHGSYNRHTRELSTKRGPDYFKKMSDGKMSDALIDRFLHLEQKSGALYLYHPSQRRDQPLALFCKGDEDRKRRDDECERLADLDALREGFVTSWTLVQTPPAPKAISTGGTSKNWD
jgi:hypothetical protein